MPEDEEIVKLYLPEASVKVPLELPLYLTETDERGLPFSSVTVPETVCDLTGRNASIIKTMGINNKIIRFII